jgi:hypothetical protein
MYFLTWGMIGTEECGETGEIILVGAGYLVSTEEFQQEL